MYYIINKSGTVFFFKQEFLFIDCINIKSYFGVFSGSMTAKQWFLVDVTTE